MEKLERAVTVALWLGGDSEREELSFAELNSLAATAGVGGGWLYPKSLRNR